MEFINEFILLNLSNDKSIKETSCISDQNQAYFFLTYHLSGNDCLFDFSKSNNVISIRIAKSYFEKYDASFELLIEKQSICCNTQSKLYELVHSKLTGIERQLNLESIVLYLLFQVQKNSLLFQLNCDTCSFINKPLEMDKILKAKEFITSNLDQNLTIPIIATYVGTNQCYLKKGFKEIYNSTIFEFIQENRMVKAKHLMSETEKSITEVAEMVGYASVSSFSQAYKNYYGSTPSNFQKLEIPNS